MASPRNDPATATRVSFLSLFRTRTFFGLPKSQGWCLISKHLDRPERSHLLSSAVGISSGAGAFLFSALPVLSSFLTTMLRGWCCPAPAWKCCPSSLPPHPASLLIFWASLLFPLGRQCCHVLDLWVLLFFAHQQYLNLLKLGFALLTLTGS